jgi:ADP-ribose pyrophosphatase YjhB (NUDIX family)
VAAVKVRATAVLIEGNEILLVEQQVSASRGWSLPGGALEVGETLAECVAREVREETGLQVAVEDLLYVCDRMEAGQQVVHVTFAVKRLGGCLRPGLEPEPGAHPIESVQMVPIARLIDYGFAPRFRDLALAGFPDRGTYRGSVTNIGL